MSEWILRVAEESDVAQMAVLDRICFASPWSEKSFYEEIVENQLAAYFVAECQGRIVGYAGLWMIVDEGHITNVAVHPEFRQKGIAKELLELLITSTQQRGMISHTLEVRPSNRAAIALYSKFGFREAGRRIGYYEDNGEDALIMWRYSSENGDRK